MSERSGVIGVKVENQVLWVGREAYPVRNIARARVVRLTIRRAAAFGRFLGFTLLWLVLGMGATLGLRAARSQGVHLDKSLGQVVVIVTAVLIGISAVRLLYLLLRPALFALVIETAGNPYTALATTERHILDEIVHAIMAAVDDPRVVFHKTVNYTRYGDTIGGDKFEVGGHGIGKIVH
ncbi:DUF6232 family protein [Amycolatopsis sp. NPDC098790]|uniref:DUF6232 family protein n=1 Tax=Amycolatopsis sp. NPDC098790 TaxID=3363939 RepID=UPI0037FD4CCE